VRGRRLQSATVCHCSVLQHCAVCCNTVMCGLLQCSARLGAGAQPQLEV
jgi:hypothetical protein